MKKTILAAAITMSLASVSSGALASTNEVPLHKKTEIINNLAELAGKNLNIEGSVLTYSKNGATATVDLATVSNDDLSLIKNTITDDAINGIDQRRENGDVNNKIALANELLTKFGEYAQITNDKDGNTNLTFISPISGETRQINLSGASDEEIATLKNATREYLKTNAPVTSPVSPSNDEKIALVNEKFEQLGFNAEVYRDQNGNVQFSFTDNLGNELTENLSELTPEQLAQLKDITKEEGKKQHVGNPQPITPSNDEKIALVNEKFEQLGFNAEVYRDPNGNVQFSFTDNLGNERTENLSDLTPEQLAQLKDITKEEGKKQHVGNPQPITPSNDEKIALVNEKFEQLGFDAEVYRDPNGNVQFSFTDNLGNERTENLSDLTSEQLEQLKDITTEEGKKQLVTNPQPVVPTNDEKIALVNEKFEQLGFNAEVYRDPNGNVQFSFTDNLGNERTENLSDLTPEQLAQLKNITKEEGKKQHVGNPQPITPSNDEKIALVNEKFEQLGFNAEVYRDPNGNVQFSFTDNLGNERTENLSDLTPEQIAQLKDITKEEGKKQLVGLPPEEDSPTVPESEIDRIVKGLQKASDNLQDKSEKTVDTLKYARGGLTQAKEKVQTEIARIDQYIEGANEAITKNQQQIVRIDETLIDTVNQVQQLDQDITAGKSVLTQAGQSLKNSAENAVGLLQEQRQADIEKISTYISTGSENAKTALTSELADLQLQIDDLNNIDNPGNGDINEDLIGGLTQAKEKVQTEIARVDTTIKHGETAIQQAAQNLVQTGKDASEKLIEQRQQDANALMAVMQSMQAQMDAQAKQISELQAGENPGINPPTGIDQEVRDGLQLASNTMQQKMNEAQTQLTNAADKLKEIGDIVKHSDKGNGEVGINPPSQGGYPMDHEWGSVGEGQAKAWLNEEISSGVTEYVDTRLNNFEDEFKSMYTNDMENFYEDVDERMDDVMASQHAITNSRPFLTNGATAVGVGVGFAGDSSAVAVGVAHSFMDTGWSLSGSINATSGSNTDVSAGAGVQYSF